ncbi:PIR protein [Plasmodium yoelii]|uniref:PIR protein n=2 Tax=Plasmodium yoelii TaxID=5861 RepID=A0AAE9WXS0_PLAYO|nr:PIR protein [Plasmodium yoelii]WBY58373.1 PIR protein [Plasmodium yoelii yoelii]CDU18703.1 YIR protein [Plasmodium yoelii]VTZ79288.1 PIR protein [Plasmodium yoelii]|eukprot:XP_022812323.1 PIR protein [Plasmodium yoelii]
MNDDLCRKFVFLRTYLPDDLSVNGTLELKDHKNFKNYCPVTESGENECNNNLGKITAGFLWLLEQCYSISINSSYNENNTNLFFIYMISWFSYQLNKIKGHDSTKIKDFYTKYVINSHKYDNFKNTAYKFTKIEEFIDKKNDLLNINIQDLSKFYDAFKLLCSMYGDISTNTDVKKLSDDANEFVKKYQELKGYSNHTDGNSYKQILSALLTDYDNLKNISTNITPLPEITANVSALSSGDTSSTGNKLFTVLSIFGAIAFFLGISYKYSLFGFRKRAQKQYLREKIKNIKKRMNS